MFDHTALEYGSTSTQTTTKTQLCPVHTLPTELLTRIFIIVVAQCKTATDLTYNVPQGSVNTTNIHPPLALSQTCRRWRDIALDMPELWTVLSNTVIGPQNLPTQVNRGLFGLLLSRTRQLPLSACVMADARAANKLTPHMDRVCSLELGDFPDPYKLVPLMRPAPALESLLVTTRTTQFDPQFSTPRAAPVLFSDSAPSLRALALLNPTFLPLQLFSALTELHIGSMSKAHLLHLLGLLDGMPALESLAITDLRFPISGWVFGGGPIQQLGPPVRLHRLRRLALVRTPLMRGLALLEHLSLPRAATVHIIGLLDDSSIHRIVTPLPLLPQLPPVSAANALEMVVCGGTLAFRTRVLAADGSVASGPRAYCTAHWGTNTYGWWKGLWQTLPCAQLTELRVAVDADDDELLPRFLQAAIALVTLELRFHPGEGEGHSLENAPTHLDGAPLALLGVCALLEQEMPPVCLCLADLALIDAASSPKAWDGLLWAEDASPRVAYVSDLLRVVAARAAVGRRLRRIALQGLWSRAHRDRVRSAFEMGAGVTNIEFRELDGETSPLFEFEDDRDETWANGHWTYELPKSTLPWAPANGSRRRDVQAPVVKVLEMC